MLKDVALFKVTTVEHILTNLETFEMIVIFLLSQDIR